MKIFQRLYEPDSGNGAGGTGSGGGNGTTNREGAGAPPGAGAAAGSGAPASGGQGTQPNGGGPAQGGAPAGGAQAPGGAGASPAGNGPQPAQSGVGAGAPDDPAARWNTTRTGWAGQDQAKLNWANRYASQQAMLDAAWAAQDRIAKGELARPLPENPTAEQVADYRKAHGIPEKPEGYWDAVKDVKLEDMDKEIIAPYLPVMHELNLSPAQASKLINFRQAEVERQIDEQITADNTLRQQTEDALRGEWGSQYRQNVEAMRSFIGTRFGEAAEDLLNARTPGGDPLLGSPTVLRALLQMAMDLNGGQPTIVLPDGKLADGAGVDARMGELHTLMANTSSEYWKGPNAERLQAEYRQLVEYQERNAARAGAGARR